MSSTYRGLLGTVDITLNEVMIKRGFTLYLNSISRSSSRDVVSLETKNMHAVKHSIDWGTSYYTRVHQDPTKDM